MNSRHRKTLEALFASPIPKTLAFRRVESLLKSIGCVMIEGEGSRVAFYLAGRVLALHRPHPGNEIKPYQIRATQMFLISVGVRP